MHAKYSQNSRAFTLIETLVAITILMISISGPLAIANKALTASLYAKDQSTASFLAQEEMELIKNSKDNNAGTNWLIVNGINMASSCATNVNQCDLNLWPSGSPTVATTCNGGCQLYDDNFGYNHSNSGSPTIFSRSFYLTSVGGTGNEYQVTVAVSWNEGTIQNAVTLSSEITNVAP